MRTLTTINDILAAAQGRKLYIRWSRGPALDRKQGASHDYGTGQAHNGLSVQPVRVDNPQLLAEMLPEYQYLRGKDARIYCWIMAATENGRDSDNAPTVDATSIEPVGQVADTLIARCAAYAEAARAHRRHYAYNAWKPEHHARNAELEQALADAWAALQ